MKQNKTLTYLMFLVMLLLLGSCDTEDDVIEIFTGKTWRLSYISLNGPVADQDPWFDFWNGNTQAKDNSLRTWIQNLATYTITFNGSNIESFIGGDFEAQGVNQRTTGTWRADGNSRELHFSDLRHSGNESDPLARAFQTGLQNAISYSGDSQYLYIYYEDGQTTKCMAFHIQ